MAINWDEIRKKAQAKGMQAESQVNFTRATPSLPRADTLPRATTTPINPSTFRNAPALTKITPQQQAKNQTLAVEELSGNQGNIASFARGAALATLDPFGLRKLTPQGSNVAQEQASAKNTFNLPAIKNPRAVAQGLTPVNTGNISGTYEGLGEFAGSMVGVDPVGIGLTKGVQKGLQIANKQAAKIPVLVNGKTVFVDAATQGVSKNVSAPLPRVLSKAVTTKNAPAKKPSLDEFINSQSIFHGTTADIERPLIQHANIFEPTLNRGIYTTADKSIADNYANGRMGSNGKVFTYKKPDIEKTFNYHNDKDLERVGIKIPDHYKSKTAYNEYMNKAWKSEGIDYSKNMDSAREDAIFDRLAIRALKNMGDSDAVNTWRNIKNTPLSEMAAEQDYMVEKVLNQINDDLIKDGFNFAQHKGGIRQGNKPHDVYIALKDDALEEQNIESLTQLYNNTYSKPQPLPRATESTVQPILPQKGAEIPKEQPFTENEDLRNNFSQAHGEKFEADYNNFMKETEDLPDVQTGASEFAQRITSKGVSRGKDIQRIADSALRHSKEAREWFKRTVEDPLYISKGKMATEIKTKLDKLHKEVVTDLGIKKASKESAAVQWYGEGKKQRTSGKNKSTETVPYTIDDLKADFNYTMPNGKKAWENIVQAEGKIRVEYMRYVDKINESLRKIYPNVEANVEKLQAKLAKTVDPEARKAVLQEIEDATVGKRLQPRQDYFRHFQEQQQGFLVGLDNVINGATNIDPRLIGVSEFAKPNSKWTGFLQRRKDGDIYAEDAIGGLLEYIPQAEYKINIEPNIPILRGVIKELKESTIQSRNANSFIDELMQITNDLAGKSNKWDRNFADFFGDEKGRKVLNALSTVSNRMRKNAVMGNFNSMIAQFFNLPNVVGYAKNPIDLADGFKTSIQASMGNKEAKALLDKSMFLKERYIDRSFRQFNTGILDNTEKFFSWTMELGDKAIADGAWLTFYKQAIKTMDESSAILKADEMTRKSIGGRGIGEMPLSQKAKVTKLFAPFQVEVRNAVNVLEDLGRAKDVGGLVGVFVTSYLLNEVLKATTGREIGFNPFGTVQDSIEDGSNVVAGLVGNTITNIPGGSYVASAGASALGLNEYQMQELFGQNDPSRFGTGNIALQTLATPVGQAVKGQNIDLLKPLAATLPRFGGKQFERGIRGLQDMAVLPKEKINLTEGILAKKQDFPASLSQSGRLRFAIEPNVQNYLTAPTLGTWSTKEGKDYIENERQPLGEKQTSNVDSLYRLGIEPKMAETIIRGLSGLTKKEEKMQFINTMNLDKSTKKTLLEDILGYSTDNIKPEERIDFGIDKAGLTSDQRTTYKSSVAPLGIDDKTYARIVNEMDANGSGRVSHEEAQAILDSTNLTREQKYKMWNVIDARWVEKNNPYR